MESFHVATFHSVSQALRFEKLLQQEKIAVKMIPVPRILSSSCGIAARFGESDLPAVTSLFAGGYADAEGVYLLTYPGKKVSAQKLPGPWDNTE